MVSESVVGVRFAGLVAMNLLDAVLRSHAYFRRSNTDHWTVALVLLDDPMGPISTP